MLKNRINSKIHKLCKKHVSIMAFALSLCILLGLASPLSSLASTRDSLTNVALNKTVIARRTADNSVAQHNPDRPPTMATDGIVPSSTSTNYFDFGKDATPDSLYMQVDLGQSYSIDNMKMWRYWGDGRKYNATLIAVSDNADFSNPKIVFNSDSNNVHGLGAGSDPIYTETSSGRAFPATAGTSGRYVRVYVYGSDKGTTNHIIELEVYASTTAVEIPAAFENAPEPLDIKCPPIPHTNYTDNATHPDVIHFDTPWNGYKFWMGFTPNMTGSSYYETPCITASNDGIEWVIPEGLTNPIQPRIDSTTQNENEHYCDTDIVFDSKNNRLILYWEWARDIGTAESEIRYRVSYDGINWGTPNADNATVTTGDDAYGVAIHTDGARYSDLSPTIDYDAERDLYLMWANDAGNVGYNNGNNNKVWVRYSKSGLDNWSEKKYVNNLLGNNASGVQLYPWHIDVQYIEEFKEFWAVVQAFPAGTNPNSSALHLSKSKDGVNWEQVGNQKMLSTSKDETAWDYGQIYRSTFWYEPGENYGEGTFHLWYAGLSKNNTYWKIGYTKNDYSNVMKSLVLDNNYITPEVVDATAVSFGEDKSVVLGKSVALAPIFTPANAGTRLVKYVSDDPSVASVDPFGNVTTHKIGVATITAIVTNSETKPSTTIAINVVDKAPKRYSVDNENPMLIVPLYGAKSTKSTGSTEPAWQTGELDWGDTLKGRWDSIPDDLKPYSIIEIHPGGEIGTNSKLNEIQNFYKVLLDQAEEHDIPVMIVVATAGQQPQWTGTTNLTEDYLDGLFKKYSSLKGLMSTENYWTSHDRVANESLKFLKVADENGGFFMWSEQKVGVLESINANATLKDAISKYSDSFLMTFKNTPASSGENPGSNSIIQGMWLTDMCAEWGGLMDTWKWWEQKHWALFDKSSLPGGANGGEEARCVVSEPEALLQSEMMNIYLNGGSIYNFEHPGYVYGSNDKASPVFENVITEFMRYAIANPAPSKAKIIENTKVVFASEAGANFSSISSSFYKGLNCEDYNQPTYTTGRYGLIPVIVKEVSKDKIKSLLPNATILTKSSPELATQAEKVNFFNKMYPEEYSGTAFGKNNSNIWFFYNSNENVDIDQHAEFTLESMNARVDIEPHTNVIMDTKLALQGKINVALNNYRVDKSPIWDGYTSSTPRWNTDTNSLMEAYIEGYTANPLDDVFRQSTITLSGIALAPTIKVNSDSSQTEQYDIPTVDYNDGVAVITVMNNGYLDFDILIGDENVVANDVKLDKNTCELPLGRQDTLNATVLPLEAADKRVSWSSSDEDVVTVDANGNIIAVDIGTATITVTLENGTASDTCLVEVKEIPVTAITFEENSRNMWTNSKLDLVPEIIPALNSDSTLKWESSNTSVATVDKNGVVSALKGGTVLITATSVYGPSAWVFITVDSAAYKEIPRIYLTASSNSEHFSSASEGLASYAIDGNNDTIWHSGYASGDTHPAAGENIYLNIKFEKGIRPITRFDYTPRSGASNGTVLSYNLLGKTADGEWTTIVSKGVWEQTATMKSVFFDPIEISEIRLEVLTSVGKFGSASEIRICEQGSPIDPERIVENIKVLYPIDDNANSVTLPSMYGYDIRIVSSSDENVIGLDGKINRSQSRGADEFKNIDLVLGLTCSEYEGESKTKPIQVNVKMTGTIPPAELDTDELDYLIDMADEKVAEGALDKVSESVKNMFNSTLKKAKELIDKATATPGSVTQNDITTMESELSSALDKLEDGVNKSGLQRLFDTSASYVTNKDSYTSASYAEFKEAYDKAAEVLADDGATTTQINRARSDLLYAISQLKEIELANKTQLEALLDEAANIDTTNKRPALVTKLKNAITAAQAVMDNINATQAQVNEASTNLFNVIVNLKDIIDRSDVNYLIGLLEKLKSDEYTSDSWNKLQSAIEKSNKLSDDSSQKDVNEAYENLVNAFENLKKVSKKVDKSTLENVLNNGKLILDNINDFIKSTVSGLKAAYNKAKAVFDNPNATQEEVDQATAELSKVIAKARIKENKELLQKSLKRALAFDSSLYTKASFEVLQVAIIEAEKVIDDDESTSDEIAKATKLMQGAIAQLVKLKEDDTDTDKTKDKDNTDTDKTKDKTNNVKTGESSPLLLVLIFIISSLAVFFSFRKKHFTK